MARVGFPLVFRFIFYLSLFFYVLWRYIELHSIGHTALTVSSVMTLVNCRQ